MVVDYDFFIHENVFGYDIRVLIYFAQKYGFSPHPCVDNPVAQGIPMKRPRKITGFTNDATCYLDDNPAGLLEMFARDCVCDGSIFFCAPPEEVPMGSSSTYAASDEPKIR